ncbi:MAG: adenylosuccinate synthetase [Deltaproteobacteria bacterium]|nr:adenylosuccinate synthetase [Deltaproteobacteria bacterium]
MRAWAVVDLGFGDAGKGRVVDGLCRSEGADLVARFNGGAQAGHNVVSPDGRHHTFSQFCAGTLAGVPGLLGPDFLLHPLAMLFEAEHLVQVGVPDPFALLAVDRRARLITPYQQAANRAREQARGATPHGSCGVGIGECVADSLSHPGDTLRAGDLPDRPSLRQALSRQRERKRAEVAALGEEDLSLFEDDALIERVLDAWGELAGVLTLLDPAQVRARVAAARALVLEGAQGVLLDQDWGLHPHTTWSDCTFAGALALAGDRPVTRIGVSRSYQVRHGAGPFPTEGTLSLPEPHNTRDPWQGDFRTGALDLVLLRYALQVSGGVDRVVLTHLDRLATGPVCVGYRGALPDGMGLSEGGLVRRLVPGARSDLAWRERLGGALGGVEVVLETRDIAVAVAGVVAEEGG